MIGRTISHYKILEKLGEGGMGAVYKAEDTKLKRIVALKFLSPSLTRNEAAKKRFVLEAQAASALQNNNICVIHEIDETVDGQMYICMDYYDGEPLNKRIERGPLPIDEAIATGEMVAAGLAAAHDRGIVHRDIKPANLVSTRDGVIKLVDFGVAKLSGQTKVTKTGMTVGTATYMSPEQARGDEIDHRSDIFSLGVVLYELLTSQRPFRGDTELAVLYGIVNSAPEPIANRRPDIPRGLARIVERALAKDPDNRFQSARELRQALAAVRTEPEPTSTEVTREAAYTEGSIDSLAVLPFTNESADPEGNYLSDGLTDTLIDKLCQIPRLRVMARSTVFQYGEKRVSPHEVGEALGVRAVLTGRLLQRGDELVIRAELVDTTDGTRLWGERFKRPFADVLAIEEEISREIAQNLRVKINPKAEKLLAKRQTQAPEAYRAYLKGRHVWNRWKTPEGMRTAIGFFERALEIDPLYALAFAGLADSYCILGNVKAVPPGEAYPKARTFAQQGLAIDDTVAELYSSLAFVHRFWDWDWRATEKAFQKSISLNPGYATAYRWWGQHLTGLGHFDKAIVASSRALELDPLSLIIKGALGDVYFYARRYDEAIALYQETIETDPGFLAGHTDLARAYELSGRYDEAITEFETAAALAPGGPPEPSSGLAHVYAQMGSRDRALGILEQLIDMRSRRYVSAYGIASIYSCLREIDAAFEWLERAFDEHDQTLVWVKVHPRLDPLRSDARFDRFLEKMHL